MLGSICEWHWNAPCCGSFCWLRERGILSEVRSSSRYTWPTLAICCSAVFPALLMSCKLLGVFVIRARGVSVFQATAACRRELRAARGWTRWSPEVHPLLFWDAVKNLSVRISWLPALGRAERKSSACFVYTDNFFFFPPRGIVLVLFCLFVLEMHGLYKMNYLYCRTFFLMC